jgi:hypothetical protein
MNLDRLRFRIDPPGTITTQQLNEYGADWVNENYDEIENSTPQQRINHFTNYVITMLNNNEVNITDLTRQRIREYAREHINILFDDEDNNHNRIVAQGKKRKTRRARKTKIHKRRASTRYLKRKSKRYY